MNAKYAVCLLACAVLAGCGQSAPMNPPTEPARPITEIDPTAAVQDGQMSTLPGRGPTSFVGNWAAEASWCAAPVGARRPIAITSTHLESYEDNCQIGAIDQVVDGYVATLVCLAEGTTRTERARFAVTGDVMRLSWLDRSGDPVTLLKCTTLDETATPAASMP